MILLNKIPSYSEFLLSFALIYFVVLISRQALEKASATWLLLLAAASLLATFIPYEWVNIPILGVFIGTDSFCCFPILQYLSYFIFGTYLAKSKTIFNPWLLGICLIGSAIFFGYIWHYAQLPSRFPPSIIWIIGGYLFVYAYFLLCKSAFAWLREEEAEGKEAFWGIGVISRILNWIRMIGQKTLSYLVISNVIIFAAYYLESNQFIFLSKCESYIFDSALFVICVSVAMFFNYAMRVRRRSWR